MENNNSPYAISLEKERQKNNLSKSLRDNKTDENKEEPIKTLDNLFKKTFTKPHIYYLPLSEEEVIIIKYRLKRKRKI